MSSASGEATGATSGAQHGGTVPSIVQQQAAVLGDRPFVEVYSTEHGVVRALSFAEFGRRVACAQAVLSSRGVDVGVHVGLLTHATVNFFVYCFGVMCGGGVAVNLSWRQPKEQLAVMTRVAGCRVLIASGTFTAEARHVADAVTEVETLCWLPPPAAAAPDATPPADAAPAPDALPSLDGAVLSDALSDATRAAAALPAPALTPEMTAVVMFTSGSTSTPKAVPLTHGGLLWNCAAKAAVSPKLVGAPGGGTLSLLPNFHVIGFTNNFLFNLTAGLRAAVLADAGAQALTATLMLGAIKALKPTVVDTVPFLAEEMLLKLDKGEPAAQALRHVAYLLAGGASLNEELLLPVIHRHGVPLWPHYGQTEVGGPALTGGLEGCLSAMRPPPAIQWQLLDEHGATLPEGDGELALLGEAGGEAGREGELVLLGLRSATRGYMAGSGGRDLSGGHRDGTAARFVTGDVFRETTEADGLTWLHHTCRQDDLLLHSTGEMTNPLPIEAALLSRCSEQVKRLCVFGQKLPTPALVVEPKEGVGPVACRKALLAVLPEVNASQPSWSNILPLHIQVLDVSDPDAPRLPTSVKGNVIRSLVEKTFTPALTAETSNTTSAQTTDESSSNHESSSNSSGHGAERLTLGDVLKTLEKLVGMPFDADVPIMAAGFTSVLVPRLIEALEKLTGQGGLTPTLLFDHPTPRRMVDAINGVGVARRSTPELPAGWDKAPHVAVAATRSVLPAGVDAAGELAQLARTARDVLGSVPAERWAADCAPPGLEPLVVERTKHGAFMHGAALFDNGRVNTSPAEAAQMDPQQRLLLDIGYAALHGAGFVRAALDGSGVGVAVGIYALDFQTILELSGQKSSAYAMTGASLSITSGRVSFALGLHGPCASYDTACSASLVATHGAVRALQHGECAAHLAAGVNTMLLQAGSVSTAVAGMTSVGGKCHTFDARADGFARGEGVGTVALQQEGVAPSSLLAAGSAVRQDGRSASLTAPSGVAQHMLLDGALADAGAANGDMAMREAHGTGTGLGDPIEVSSIVASAREAPPLTGAQFAFAGIKASIGHAESAAGVAGLLTLAVGLNAGDALPNTQLRAVNPQVRSLFLTTPPCALSAQLGAAPTSTGDDSSSTTSVDGATMGGVSSFGFSGTIAHAILQSAASKATPLATTNLTSRRVAFTWQPDTSAATAASGAPSPGEMRRGSTVGKLKAAGQAAVVANALSRRASVKALEEEPSEAKPKVEPTTPKVLEVANTFLPKIGADTPLMDAGLDSLGAVELRDTLQELNEAAVLPVTLVFDYPSVNAIGKFLDQLFEEADEPPPTMAGAGEEAKVAGGAGCVGMHGPRVLLPANGHSDERMWRMSTGGADCVGQIPPTRWSAEAVVSAIVANGFLRGREPTVKYGGFVNGADLFDTAAFAISHAEAKNMDPQHRLLLEQGYYSLHEAELSRAALVESATAVFVGIQQNEFTELKLATQPDGCSSAYAATGSPHGVACGRVAFALGLQGPCAAVDTACSASLVAYHCASSALYFGETGDALVAGVNLFLLPVGHVLASLAGLTSPHGRCHTFDSRADGYARAEALAALTLCILEENEMHPPAVGMGSAVRADGKSASLTAPNGAAQKQLNLSALSVAGEAADQLTDAEAHGTGTALGDPIETGSLAAVYLGSVPLSGALCGGSIKANSGHPESSAGLAGLLRLQSSLTREARAPNALLRVLNEYVHATLSTAARDMALPLQASTVPSDEAESRVARETLLGGVSSFGFGGTIAHVLVGQGAPKSLFDYRLASLDASGALEDRAPFGQLNCCRRVSFLWETITSQQRDWMASGKKGGGKKRGKRAAAPAPPAGKDDAGPGPAAAPTTATSWEEGQEGAEAAQPLISIEAIQKLIRESSGINAEFDAGLMDSGVDSMGATELVNGLQGEVGSAVEVPSTLIFDYPTARSIADFFAQQSKPADALAAMAPAPDRGDADEMTCVVDGVSLLLAQGTTTRKLMRAVVASGADLASTVPTDRWSDDELQPGVSSAVATARQYGSFLVGVPCFDNNAFAITPNEAKVLDPMQRLLLERGFEALSVAGQTRSTLDGSDCGVYVGITATDYVTVLNQIGSKSPYQAVAVGHSIAAGRISFALGLRGPCAAIDTSCSSTLAACQAGLHSLIEGCAHISLVAGVNVLHTPTTVEILASAGMLSYEGRCATFDEAADGYLRAEGCCGCVLRLTDDEKEDEGGSDEKTMNLLACAVGQDGKSASLTAPNGQAQQALMLAGVAMAGATPQDFTIVEAHGTGTKLGDPIEAGSITKVLLELRDPSRSALCVGSVKANLGHAEPVAGMVGFLKLALALQHAEAPPNAQLRVLNPLLTSAIKRSALACLQGPLPDAAEAGATRMGGVNSFGYQGTIAHTILQTRLAPGSAFVVEPKLVVKYKRRLVCLRAKARAKAAAAGTTKPKPPALAAPAAPAAPVTTELESSEAEAAPLLTIAEIEAIISTATGMDADVDLALMDAGLDSLAMVDLANELQEAAGGGDIPATLMFDFPSARALGKYFGGASKSSLGAMSFEGAADASSGPCAVGGISIGLPLGVGEAKRFWPFVLTGADASTHVPAERWDTTDLPAAPTAEVGAARNYGAFLQGTSLFDQKFFSITKAEAKILDPMQRIALERGYEALYAGGQDKLGLVESATGVYVGITATDFVFILEQRGIQSAFSATATGNSIASGRISFALGLRGPCMSIDTACSATLAASQCAVNTLQNRTSTENLIIGTNMLHTYYVQAAAAGAGMNSSFGRCATFDESADGYLRAEGCCGCVLRLAQDGDAPTIHVLACAVSQDGKSASLTAPNGQAQQAVMLSAYVAGAFDPAGVSVAEAHGTGTPLGDPIEAGSITEVLLSRRTADTTALCVGSVKANLGHAEPVAGMIGFLKMTLCLEHARTPPNAQLRVLNHLLKAGGFVAATLAVEHATLPHPVPGESWATSEHGPAGGVSSFGFSGTICHAVARASAPASVLPATPFTKFRKSHFQVLTYLLGGSSGAAAGGAAAAPGGDVGGVEAITTSIMNSLGLDKPIDFDTPLEAEGLDSLGAMDVRNSLQALFPTTAMPASLVFDYPTSRQLVGFLGGGAVARPIVAASTTPAAPAGAPADPMAYHEKRMGPWLYQCKRGDALRPPIFLVPSTDGNGLLYGKGPALGALQNPLYAIVFEYLHSGDKADLRFDHLHELGTLLAGVLLQQLACLGTGHFHLLGANLAAPLMKFTALAALKRGTRPCKLVLIDPLPAPPYTPVAGRPYLLAEGVDAKYVAEVLMRQNRVPDVEAVLSEQLGPATEEEVGVIVASSLSQLGFKPFTRQTVLETQRELRDEIMFERMIRRFVAERWAGGEGVAARLEAEVAASPFAGGVLCARAGKGRVEFFADAFGLQLDETTVGALGWYGEAVEEPQLYDGHHIDVCLRLFTGREKAFSERLLAFMEP